MITATKARELTNNAVEKEIATYRANAEQFCETLAPQIEEKASKKISNLIFELPNAEIKGRYVIEILKENGFQTNTRNDGKIEIIW